MERVEPIWHRFAFACRALKHFCMKKLLIASAIRQIVCECYYEFKDFNFFDLQQSFNGNKKIFVRNAFIFVTCLIVYWLITCCVYSPNCLAWDMCSSIHFYIFIFFFLNTTLSESNAMKSHKSSTKHSINQQQRKFHSKSLSLSGGGRNKPEYKLVNYHRQTHNLH